MRRRLMFLVATLLAYGGLATPARPQDVAGTVRDSLNGFPVSGAVVMLLDSARVSVDRGLTDEHGAYRIPLRAPARILRVVRIGYEPREVALANGAAGGAPLDFEMTQIPSMLVSVRVQAPSLCSKRKDRAAALGLWEQAQAGLLATIVARESNPASVHRLGFERVMDGNSNRVVAMRVRTDSADAAATSFFAPHSAQDLVRYGFSSDSTKNRTYFGPDAEVLLDDYFAESYCFELRKAGRERPNQVGLRFVPAARRRNRVDIDGTLWIDTVARALKDIEYTYLGVDYRTRRFHAGGHVSFRTMANGVVLIDQWWIRLVSAAPDSLVEPLGLRDWFYADETGGELARATWRDGLTWKAPLGMLELHAITADGKPAVGSVIALPATRYFGTADVNGMVRIPDLLPGPYGVRVIDPRVASLGIGVPTPLRIIAAPDSTTLATVIVPSTESYVSDRCAAAREPVPPRALFVLGRVVTPDGRPLRNAHVSFTTKLANPLGGDTLWTWLHQDATTGPDGLFQACHDWNVHDEIMIRVRREGAPELYVRRAFASNLIVVRVPLAPGAGGQP